MHRHSARFVQICVPVSVERVEKYKDADENVDADQTRTGRPVDGPPSIQSCVPVSVEFVDKDEDAEENVDADQTRTVRPVSGQSFTQLEELDIDFRVPGLPNAIVKQAENFRVRSKVILIEKHFKPTCSRITPTTHSVRIRKR